MEVVAQILRYYLYSPRNPPVFYFAHSSFRFRPYGCFRWKKSGPRNGCTSVFRPLSWQPTTQMWRLFVQTISVPIRGSCSLIRYSYSLPSNCRWSLLWEMFFFHFTAGQRWITCETLHTLDIGAVQRVSSSRSSREIPSVDGSSIMMKWRSSFVHSIEQCPLSSLRRFHLDGKLISCEIQRCSLRFMVLHSPTSYSCVQERLWWRSSIQSCMRHSTSTCLCTRPCITWSSEEW